jgi:hypothetical protein
MLAADIGKILREAPSPLSFLSTTSNNISDSYQVKEKRDPYVPASDVNNRLSFALIDPRLRVVSIVAASDEKKLVENQSHSLHTLDPQKRKKSHFLSFPFVISAP